MIYLHWNRNLSSKTIQISQNTTIHHSYIQILSYSSNTVTNVLCSHLLVAYLSNVSQKFPLFTVYSIILGGYLKL